jgi:hypothetical protein
MTMKLLGRLAAPVLLAGLGLAACATPERFTWGGYDASLYAYSKHPEQLAQFEKTLQQSIASGKASGRLAPGLQAELGYCYLGEGRKSDAVAQFKAEMASFPESAALMTRIISQIES